MHLTLSKEQLLKSYRLCLKSRIQPAKNVCENVLKTLFIASHMDSYNHKKKLFIYIDIYTYAYT